MNKEEFFDALQRNLDYIPQDIADKIVEDYEKKFSSNANSNLYKDNTINDIDYFQTILFDIRNTYNLSPNQPLLSNTVKEIIEVAVFLALVFAIIPFCINIIITCI